MIVPIILFAVLANSSQRDQVRQPNAQNFNRLQPAIVHWPEPLLVYGIKEVSAGSAMPRAVLPEAINNNDDIAGRYDYDGASLPILVRSSGAAWFLDFTRGFMTDMDDSGRLSAIIHDDEISAHTTAVQWNPSFGTSLPPIPSGINLVYINAKGSWVGYKAANAHFDAYVGRGSKFRTLEPLKDYEQASAYMVNDRGDVIGSSYTPSTSTAAVTLWSDPTRPREVALPAGVRDFDKLLISNNGTIAGRCTENNQLRGITQDGAYAFVSSHGRTTIIPFDRKVLGSTPVAINDHGDVIGEALLDIQGTTRPWLYTEGRTYFLEDLLPKGSEWTLQNVRCINGHGDVGGLAAFDQSSQKGYVMIKQRTGGSR